MVRSYDIHISANKILFETIKKLEEIGFIRDEFMNNRRCDSSKYHGTIKLGVREKRDDELWEKICLILKSDNSFEGGLEEEVIDEDNGREYFEGEGKDWPKLFEKIKIEKVPIGKHKACDIHIAINLDKSCVRAVDYLENMGIAFFDRIRDGNLFRVYTITCEDYLIGLKLFERLKKEIFKIPRIFGKIKVECVSRFYRYPKDASVLPISNNLEVKKWLESFD